MKIGTKIILIITVLIAISAITGSATYFITAKQIIETKINAHLESVATLKENQLSNFLNVQKERVVEIASEQEFISGVVNATTDKAGIRKLLQERLLLQSDVIDFSVLKLDGEVLASTDPSQEGKFRLDETYFVNGQKETYIQNFYHDIAISRLASTVATPIKDANGKVFGVFAARVNLDAISALMTERSGLGATGETYLVNNFNTIISATRSNSGEFGRMVYTEGITNCLAGRDGTHLLNYENIPVIGIHRWVADKKICLVAEIKQAEAYAPIDYLRLLSFLGSLGAILFTVIFGQLFARTIVKPILMLRENTRQVTAGNLDTPISIITKDEIGELAADFRTMTANLRVNMKNLEEERAKLLASINSLPLGFVLFNVQNQMVLKNKIMEVILEEKDEYITKEMLADLVKKAKNFELTVEECLSQKRVCEFEKIEWKEKILRVIFAPIVVAGERVIGYVLIIEDTTKAETLNRTRDEFFSIASHELRTPLTAIRGNSELLQKIFAGRTEDAKLSEMIADIHESSKRLITIVNDFLDVSRIEQNKIVFKMEKVNIAEVIQETMRNMEDTAKKRQNIFVFNAPSSALLVMGDRTRISQVVFNLIGNAVNYTEHGTITITVTSHLTGFVRVIVEDTGVGIAKENQKYLFQKFQQAGGDIYTRTVSQSAGLGLYTSKLLIENMGGRLWLERSEVNKGSLFSFTLPAAS